MLRTPYPKAYSGALAVGGKRGLMYVGCILYDYIQPLSRCNEHSSLMIISIQQLRLNKPFKIGQVVSAWYKNLEFV